MIGVNSQVLEIFKRAIDRAILPSTREKKDEILAKVEEVLSGLKTGRLKPEEAYFALIGIADEYVVPLTPKEVMELRRLLLGAPVVFLE